MTSKVIAVPKEHIKQLVEQWSNDGYVHLPESLLEIFQSISKTDREWKKICELDGGPNS